MEFAKIELLIKAVNTANTVRNQPLKCKITKRFSSDIRD